MEDKIQAACVEWFNNNYCLNHHTPQYTIFAIPNGGRRDKREAMKLRATGVRSGVSDLIVVMPEILLFLEAKKPGGVQSPKQKKFELVVSKLGFNYHLFYSLKQFKEIVHRYIRDAHKTDIF
jgi:hypothetical protein